MDLDNRTVTFQTDRTHQDILHSNRGAVLMGIAVWRVAEKNGNGVNMSGNGQGPKSEMGPEWSPGAVK